MFVLLALLVVASPPGFTVASRSVLESGYQRWDNLNNTFIPSIAYTHGEVLVTHSLGNGHNSAGSLVGIQRSQDNGQTWGLAQPLYVPPSSEQALGALTMTKLRSGCVAGIYDRVRVPGYPSRFVHFAETCDGGKTWTSTQMPTFGTSFTSGGGHLIELDDGTLLQSLYTQDTCTTCGSYPIELRYTSKMAQRTPGAPIGAWTLRSEIARAQYWYGESNRGGQFEEPQCGFVKAPTGRRIMCLIREDWRGGQIFRVFSDDDGLTWGPREIVFLGIGRPSWIQLRNGQIWAVTRAHGVASNTFFLPGLIYVSNDFGVTWGGPFPYQDPVLEPFGTFMYADLIEPVRDVVVLVHAADTPGFAWRRTKVEMITFIADSAGLAISPPSEGVIGKLMGYHGPNKSYTAGADVRGWWDAEAEAMRAVSLWRTGAATPARWIDLSGWGRDLAQGPNLMPLRWPTGEQSFKALAVFTANGDPTRRWTAENFGPAIPQPFAVMVAIRSPSGSAADVYVWDDGLASVWLRKAGDGRLYMRAGTGAALFAPSPGWPSPPMVVTAIFDGMNSQIRINGTVVATGPVGALPLAGLRLGGPYPLWRDEREVRIYAGTHGVLEDELVMMRRSGIIP